MLILLLVKSLEVVNGSRRMFMNVLKQVLVLTIAAIPVGLPTVMSVTMAVGAKQLASKKVIIKRLPAIEELASVSILCSGKFILLTTNTCNYIHVKWNICILPRLSLFCFGMDNRVYSLRFLLQIDCFN